MKNSIAVRLAIVVVLAVVLIFAGTGAYVFLNTREDMRDAVHTEIQKDTELAVNKISENFALAGQVARQTALDRNVVQYLSEVTTHSQITSHELYKTVDRTLVDYNDSFDKLLFVWIANDRANFFIDNTHFVSKVGYDATSRPWYDLAMNNPGVQYTSPYADVGSGAMVVSAVTKVDTGNSIGAVVAADVSLATIPGIMEEYVIGQQGMNFLMGRDGALIYATETELVDEGKNIYDVSELAKFGEAVLAGQKAVESVTYEGEDYLIAYQPMAINGWGVIQLVNKNEIFAELTSYTQLLLMIFIVGALLLAAIVYVSIKKTLKPIGEAAAFARVLGSGDFSVDVDAGSLKRQDEMGELSKAFFI